MRLLYFASLRARLGSGGEEVAPPAGVATVAALIDWLRARGSPYAEALDGSLTVKAAVNQRHVPIDHPIKAGDEIALFPPVTGG